LHVVFRVTNNPQDIDSDTIIETLKADFQKEYFREFKSAMEPILWLEFLIEQLSDSEIIASEIRKIPSTNLESTIIPYPRRFYRLRRREWLKEKITKALHSN
jgi:hypothetical protein